MKKKQWMNKMPFIGAVSLVLIIGLYALSSSAAADSGRDTVMREEMQSMMKDMGSMMQGMSKMHQGMEKMHEECMEMMKGGMMGSMMGGGTSSTTRGVGSATQMSQEEHESHHR